MPEIAASVLLIATAIWIGAIVFQSAVVAPSVFTLLDEAAARTLLRGLFPRFFRVGLVCATLMLLATAMLVTSSGLNLRLAAVFVASLSILVMSAASLLMVPRINAARDAGSARFARLHRLSVLLTFASLLLGLGVLIVLGSEIGEAS